MLIVGASALTPCPNFAAQLFRMQTPSPSKPPVRRASSCADEVRERAQVSLRVGAGREGKGQILVGQLDSARVRAAVERAGLSAPQDLGEEGYLLAAGADGVVVAGQSAAGTFYGLQSLKQ